MHQQLWRYKVEEKRLNITGLDWLPMFNPLIHRYGHHPLILTAVGTAGVCLHLIKTETSCLYASQSAGQAERHAKKLNFVSL